MQFIKVYNLDEYFKNDCCVFKYFYEHFSEGKEIEWVTKVAPSFAITTCVSICYRVKL